MNLQRQQLTVLPPGTGLQILFSIGSGKKVTAGAVLPI